MTTPEIGTLISASDTGDFCDQVSLAESLQIPTAWTTIGGAGGADPLTAFAAALDRTNTIKGGTAIIPTWPRHPLAIAQQALSIDELAPGRLRLGIGPSHKPMMTKSIGAEWTKPLTHLREYLMALGTLFETGEVDFSGDQVTLNTSIKKPTSIELLASALRPKSFMTCGELTDGAISWMCPKTYLVEKALPALEAGIKLQQKQKPVPLIAHVPIVVSDDREKAKRLAQEQLHRYSTIPFYQAMFREAGFLIDGEAYPVELLDDLVVSGTKAEVIEKLKQYIESGCGEVLAAPLIDPENRSESIKLSFEAISEANKSL